MVTVLKWAALSMGAVLGLIILLIQPVIGAVLLIGSAVAVRFFK